MDPAPTARDLAALSSYVPIDAEQLRRLYADEGLAVDEIAPRLGCATTTVFRRLRQFAIPVRPRGPRTGTSLPRQQGSRPSIGWSPEMAWVVGVIATDGCLARDGRHLTVTSKDFDFLVTIRECLGVRAAVTQYGNGPRRLCFHLQWSDRCLHTWLQSIGLTPAKSLTLGPLAVPDEFMADFVRGCIDGDGCIRTYTDRYNASKKDIYVYERLVVTLVSASRAFIASVQAAIARTCGVMGSVQVRTDGRHHPLWCLKYAKGESKHLLAWMYHSPGVPCLARKRMLAAPFLPVVPQRRHRGMLGARVWWGSGEAGNRVALKTPCPQGLRGSSPLSPTNPIP